LALTLIGYDDELQPAMEYIFGNTLICQDATTAKRVTFDNKVRMKSVTLDGDIYDPFGTLSGGSRPNSSSVLINMEQLNTLRQDIKQHRQKLAALDTELEQAQKKISLYRTHKHKLDMQTHEVDLLESKLANSTHTHLLQRVEEIKEEIKVYQAKASQAQLDKESALQEANRIEQEMKDFNDNKGSRLKEMTVSILV
jgi:structural maintenance of chromosome 2